MTQHQRVLPALPEHPNFSSQNPYQTAHDGLKLQLQGIHCPILTHTHAYTHIGDYMKRTGSTPRNFLKWGWRCPYLTTWSTQNSPSHAHTLLSHQTWTGRCSLKTLSRERFCPQPTTAAHICNPNTWKPRQEDHCRFQANLGYTIRCYFRSIPTKGISSWSRIF